jgi:DNA invertase Pin-like site-specific DNA recombinase
MSKTFFNMLTVFAEFEVDLLKMRTREGMAIASSRGRLKGKSPSSLPASRPSWSVCAPPAATPSPT